MDFEYTDENGEKIAWSWPGEGSYKISDIMAEIGVTGEIGDVSLVRTVDMGGSANVLYLSEDKSELVSEEAFLDTFELTVVVDGLTYVLVVTDSGEGVDQRMVTEVFFIDDNYTKTETATTESGMNLNARIKLSNSDPNASGVVYTKVEIDGLGDYVHLNGNLTPGQESTLTVRDNNGQSLNISVKYVVPDSGKPYIIFGVPSGATAMYPLSFSTPNGITPDNTQVTLTPYICDENGNTITPDDNDQLVGPAVGKWTSDFDWSDINKTVDFTKHSTVSVQQDPENDNKPYLDDWLVYNYTAESLNRGETGTRWTDTVTIKDTITLPTNLTIKEGTYSRVSSEGGENLSLNGSNKEDDILVGLTLKSGMTVKEFKVVDDHTIYYEIEYKNPTPITGEIDNINFQAELNLERVNVPEDYITGEKYGEKIVNDVAVEEVPVVGEDKCESKDEVDTTVKASDGFKVSKSSTKDGQELKAGDTVDYKVTLKNTGAVALTGDDVLYDNLPSAVYLTDAQKAAVSIKIGGVDATEEQKAKLQFNGNQLVYPAAGLAPGQSIEIAFDATVVDADKLDQLQLKDMDTITNQAGYKGEASYVSSRLRKGSLSVEKTASGNVGTVENPAQDNSKASYIVTVKNESDFPVGDSVTLIDQLPPYLKLVAYDQSGTEIDLYGNVENYPRDVDHEVYIKTGSTSLSKVTVKVDTNGYATITANLMNEVDNTSNFTKEYGYDVQFSVADVKEYATADSNGIITYTNKAWTSTGEQDSEEFKGDVGKVGLEKYHTTAKLDGETAEEPFESGTIVDYTINVKNDADRPFTQNIEVKDELPAGQYPLVTGYEEKTDLDTWLGDDGQTVTIDGREVKITRNGNGYTMTWVIQNPKADNNYVDTEVITYKAVVDTSSANASVTGTKILSNSVKTTGASDTDEIEIKVKGLEIDKNGILLNNERTKLMLLDNGSRLTYELKLINDTDNALVASGIKDNLPTWGVSGTLPGSADYWKTPGAITIVEDENDFAHHFASADNTDFGYNYNNLYWNDVLVPARTTLVQKIILQFPEHDNFLDAFFRENREWGPRSTNGFIISGLPEVFVDHEEVTQKTFYMQKNVIGFSKVTEYGNATANKVSKDIFSKDGSVTDIYYSITFANTGSEVIHIDSLVDALPECLEYIGMAAAGGTHDFTFDANWGYKTNNITRIKTDNNKDNGGISVLVPGLEYTTEIPITASVDDETNVVTFKIKGEAGLDIPVGQYLNFDIDCRIKGYTKDEHGNILDNINAITNSVSAQVDLDAEPEKVSITSRHTPTGEQNNGDFRVIDRDETTGKQTVQSSVTVHPIDVAVPGIKKQVTRYKEYDEANKTFADWQTADEKTNVDSHSLVEWKITLYNDGTVDLGSGYTLTDTIYKFHKLSRTSNDTTNNTPTGVTGFVIYNMDNSVKYTADVSDSVFDLSETLDGDYRSYTFTFNGNDYIIPAGGYAEMTIVSESANMTDAYQGQIDNEALFCPNPSQAIDWNRVTHGQLEKNENGDQYIGVSSSDLINAYGDMATASYKKVQEKDDAANEAYGYNQSTGENYITVENVNDLLVYTNRVMNLSKVPLTEFVMIDHMPEVGDTGIVNASKARNSEFAVALASDPNFTVKLISSDAEPVTVALSSGDFIIEYSDKADGFTKDDFNGASEWNGRPENAKSWRIRLDPAKVTEKVNAAGGTSYVAAVLPTAWAIEVSYDAALNANAAPGQMAWNSFGYWFNTSLGDNMAEPPKVGVRLRPQPNIRKQVVDKNGVDLGVDKTKEFTFKFYEGAYNLTNLPATPYWECTAYQGGTIDLVKKQTVNGKTIGVFEEGKQYTVVETPAEGFSLFQYEVDGLNQTTPGYAVFTFNPDVNTTIVCQNKEDEDNFTAEANKSLKNQPSGSLPAFEFALYAVTGFDKTNLSAVETVESNPLKKASNDLDGKVVFDTIKYNEYGTYTYLMAEVPEAGGSYRYSDAKYLITVDVVAETVQGDIKLVATPKYYKVTDSDESDPIKAITPLDEDELPAFENEEVTSIEVEKVWDGVDSGSATMVLYSTTVAPTRTYELPINATLVDDNGDPAYVVGAGYVTVTYTSTDGTDRGTITLNNAYGWTGQTVTLSRDKVYTFTFTADGDKAKSVDTVTVENVASDRPLTPTVTVEGANVYTYTFKGVAPHGGSLPTKGRVKVTFNGKTEYLEPNTWEASFTVVEGDPYEYTVGYPDDDDVVDENFITAIGGNTTGSGTAQGANKEIEFDLTLTPGDLTMDVPVTLDWGGLEPANMTEATVTFSRDGGDDEILYMTGSTTGWSTSKTLPRLDDNGNTIEWTVSATVTGDVEEAPSVEVTSPASGIISDRGGVVLTGHLEVGMTLTVQKEASANWKFDNFAIKNYVPTDQYNKVGNTEYFKYSGTWSESSTELDCGSLDYNDDQGNPMTYAFFLYNRPGAWNGETGSQDYNGLRISSNADEFGIDEQYGSYFLWFYGKQGNIVIKIEVLGLGDENKFVSLNTTASSTNNLSAKSAPRTTMITSGVRMLAADTPSASTIVFADTSANVGGDGTPFTVIQAKDLPSDAQIVTTLPEGATYTVTGTADVNGGTAVLTGNGTVKWSDLPKVDDEGNTIYYYVVEKDATADAEEMSVKYAYTYYDNTPEKGIEKVTITNSAKANEPQTGSLEITKAVTNGNATGKTFTFNVALTLPNGTSANDIEVTGGTEGTRTTNGSVVTIPVTITGTGTITLSGIPVGTTYVVAETDQPNGWSQDGSIVYSDENTTIAANDADTAKVTNKYDATGTVDFKAKKVFTDGTLSADMPFTFKLTQVTGNQSETQATEKVVLASPVTKDTTATSGNNDTVVFDDITFTKNGTVDQTGEYWFLLEEDVPADAVDGVKDGIKYDTTRKWIKVTVEDAGDGKLTVTKAPTETNGVDGTWTNEQLGSLEFTKYIKGIDVGQADGITFTVTSDNGYSNTFTWADLSRQPSGTTGDGKDYRKITLDNLKQGTYTVTETNTSVANYSVVSTYKVNDGDAEGDTRGTVQVVAGETAEFSFTNEYTELTKIIVQKRWIKDNDTTNPDNYLDFDDVDTVYFNLYGVKDNQTEFFGTYELRNGSVLTYTYETEEPATGYSYAINYKENDVPKTANLTEWLTVVDQLPKTGYTYFVLEADATGKIHGEDGAKNADDYTAVTNLKPNDSNFLSTSFGEAYCGEYGNQVQAIKNPVVHIQAEKVWDDDGATTHPAITLHLNKKVGNAASVQMESAYDKRIDANASGDSLKVDWGYLPAYDYATGEKIEYSVTEDDVTGYASTIVKVEDTTLKKYVFTVTNSKSKTSIEATKVWTSGDQTIVWPEDVESVEFSLYAKVGNAEAAVPITDDSVKASFTGIEPTKTIESTNAEKKATWTGLPRKINNAEVEYSVKETKINYTAASGKDAETLANPVEAVNGTITNDIPKTEIEVNKAWKVGETETSWPKGVASVTVKLQSKTGNAEFTDVDGRTLTITAANNAATAETVAAAEGEEAKAAQQALLDARKFTDLPKYTDEGKLITYTVKETVITFTDGTTAEVTAENYGGEVTNEGNVFTVTNKTTELSVSKTWSGSISPVTLYIKVEKDSTAVDVSKYLVEQTDVTATTVNETSVIALTFGTEITETASLTAKLEGLPIGSYTVSEYAYKMASSEDVNLIDTLTEWTKTVSVDSATAAEGTSGTVAVGTDTAHSVAFTNSRVQSYELPSTGGTGTTVFYGAGLSLMLFALLGFVLSARKRSRGEGI